MNELDQLIMELHQTELDDPDRQFNAAIALGQNHNLAVRPRIVAELIKALRPGHQALTRAPTPPRRSAKSAMPLRFRP